MKKATLILRYFIIILAAAVFLVYCIPKLRTPAWEELAISALCLALFTYIAYLAAPKVIEAITGSEAPVAGRQKGMARRFLMICGAVIAIRIIVTLIGCWMYSEMGGSGLHGAELYRSAWMKPNTDAQHYFTIADNWYTAQGEERLMIVFFPMFPICIRLFNIIFHDNFVSAMVINTIASCLCGGFMYELMLRQLPKRQALFATLFVFVLPGAIFQCSAMTEPLFMLFSVLCFYFVADKRFIPAAVAAACAGFTRSVGVLLALPIAIEGVSLIVNAYRAKENNRGAKLIAELVFALLISTFGTLGYLYINYAVTGNAFQFMIHQKEHWHQGIGLFFDTPAYQLRGFIDYIARGSASDLRTAYVLFLAGILTAFGSLLIMLPNIKKLRASYSLYFLAYFAIAIGCTWLLSAPRYMAALVPLAMSMGMLCKKNLSTVVLTTANIALMLAYLYAYMLRTQVF